MMMMMSIIKETTTTTTATAHTFLCLAFLCFLIRCRILLREAILDTDRSKNSNTTVSQFLLVQCGSSFPSSFLSVIVAGVVVVIVIIIIIIIIIIVPDRARRELQNPEV
uniref:Uncharacterized protein n=1 Tax=Octopus bimaculoides TaxID=37653 RepID=A0A0L8HR41_OCTBM